MNTRQKAGDLIILKPSNLSLHCLGRIDVLDLVQYDELKEIFACRKVSILCETLEKAGIPYITNSKGKPMVSRDALQKAVDGRKSDDK